MDSVVGGGSEETVSDHGGPVLEEFMPLKPTPTLSSSSSEDDDEEHGSSHHQQRAAATANDDAPGDPETAAASSSRRRLLPQPETKKAVPDWLQSVQLWSNQQPSPSPMQRQDELPLRPCRPVALSACRQPGGAFQPFEKEKHKDKEKPKQRAELPPPASSSATAAASSAVVGDSCDDGRAAATDADTAGNNNNNKASIKAGGKDKEAQSSSQAPGRKPRRCWAPELHRRFLQALQQLGGSHGLLLTLIPSYHLITVHQSFKLVHD